MPKAFDFSAVPFDRLRPGEAERLRGAIDIAFIGEGETIHKAGAVPDHLVIIMKGLVEALDNGRPVDHFGPGECFDSGVLVHQRCRFDFRAVEETLAYLLPIDLFIEFTANNQPFASYFLGDISHRLAQLEKRLQTAGDSAPPPLAMMRIGDLPLSPPVFIDGAIDLAAAAAALETAGQRALLVRDGERTGMLTGMDIARAAALERRPLDTPVREVARFDLVAISEDAFLHAAARRMAGAGIRHLVVRNAEGISAILDSTALLETMGQESDALGARIDHAADPDALAELQPALRQRIARLAEQGSGASFIAEVVADLHAREHARLFEIIAARDGALPCSLFVMGSAGRGEQILKTDQDNGLVLGAEADPARVGTFARSLREGIEALGYPPCPGDIMVSNPDWRGDIDTWRRRIAGWRDEATPAALMNVAILFDARTVAGDPAPLTTLRRELVMRMQDDAGAMARFAAAIDAFDIPLGAFSALRGDGPMDIKKGALFPLVHGARALALETGIDDTGTIGRLRALGGCGRLDVRLARDAADAFDYLSGLRLRSGLERLRLHGTPDTLVDAGRLSKLERDLLKDSLRIARELRDVVRHHFRLQMF